MQELEAVMNGEDQRKYEHEASVTYPIKENPFQHKRQQLNQIFNQQEILKLMEKHWKKELEGDDGEAYQDSMSGATRYLKDRGQLNIVRLVDENYMSFD